MMGSLPASFGSNYRCKRPKRLSKKGSGLWKRPMAEEQEGTCFGKGNRKGGARHFSKPYVDTGLVFTVLEDNKEILKDLRNYECTSKNNAPDAKGLVQTLPLWKGLLRLEKSGEIHAQPLRTALIKLLSECPDLNQSGHSGQVWANLRMERITTVLFHVRKVGHKESGKECLLACAARLTRDEYELLLDGLKLLESADVMGKAQALEKAKALEKASVLEKALEKANVLEKAQAEKTQGQLPLVEDPKRKLKQHDSDVSMDSQGFPNMFKSPEPTDKEKKPVAAMAMDRRRPGNKTTPLEKGELQQALGYGTKAYKKPAAALRTKKPAAALGKAKKATLEKVDGQRKPWVKIKKTIAKKSNPRAYLTGTKEEGSKLQLIVEVTAKRCPAGYLEIIDQIWTSLEKDHLTKEEAVNLRENLCKQWGC